MFLDHSGLPAGFDSGRDGFSELVNMPFINLTCFVQVNVFAACSGTIWAAFTLRWENTTWESSTSRRHFRRTTTRVHSWEMAAASSVGVRISCIPLIIRGAQYIGSDLLVHIKGILGRWHGIKN